MITVVLGGARSGKSALAERLALADGEPVRYLATGWADPGDHDMAARIERHRAARSARFETVEVGDDLPGALAAEPSTRVLVDALGTWVARHEDFVVPLDPLLDALAGRIAPTILVSDEVGLGVHPETPVGRRFRDALGEVNQRVAEVADAVYLVVAGRAIRLEDPP